MEDLLREYLPILIFFALAVGLAVVVVVASIVVVPSHPDPEKLSAYECGFEAFDDARAVLMCGSIWLLSCLSFLIWK